MNIIRHASGMVRSGAVARGSRFRLDAWIFSLGSDRCNVCLNVCVSINIRTARYILGINVNASEEITRYKYAQLKPQVTRVTFTSVSPMRQKNLLLAPTPPPPPRPAPPRPETTGETLSALAVSTADLEPRAAPTKCIR